MRYEILLQTGDWNNPTDNPSYFYLDTFEDVTISLNYNIADITDISAKKSSYSKTIDLPDTDKNRQIFSNIFDLNIDLNRPTYSSTFNPNKKVGCIVLKDGLTQFEGNLQLTNVNYNFDTNRHIYQVVIYSENDGLFKNIGENYLTDLDLSRFDHQYNPTNMKKSWGFLGGDKEYTNGYHYPLIDYGFPFSYNIPPTGNSIRYDRFYPALYAKIIFDQIFSEAGYNYVSNFLNSPRFTNLIVPFSNKSFLPSGLPIFDGGNNIFLANKTTTSVADVTQANPWRYWVKSFNLEQDVYDPNNLYDTTNFVYQAPPNQSFRQKFRIQFKLKVRSNVAGSPWINSSDDIIIWVKRETQTDGSINPFFSNTPNWTQLNDSSSTQYIRDVPCPGFGISLRNTISVIGSVTDVGNQYFDLVGQFDTDWVDLYPNEKVRFFVTMRHQIGSPDYLKILQILPDTKVSCIIEKTIAVLSGNVQIKDVIPTKVKQKDFVSSIFKMFNLYIEPQKNTLNTFIIEPRDEYYNQNQVAKNWSDKLDITSEIETEILSNLQKRTNFFSYKSDKDFYNTNYTTNTEQVFGQFRYELDNDFIGDENKIEPIFSPTPNDRLPGYPIINTNAIIIPIVYNYNNGNFSQPDGMNIRILYRAQLPTNPSNILRIYNPLTGQNENFASYPYAGHSDDPLNPVYTLNFGQISPFYSGYNDTLNNLFNTYYRNQIFELNDINSRLVTANFYLNPFDINDFKFSDLIYFELDNMGGWYRVMKIEDYDPSYLTPTKVQLIKAYNYALDGLTFSTTVCKKTASFTMNWSEVSQYVDVINLYSISLYPVLVFWNTLDNVRYDYPYISATNSIQNIVDYCNTIPNMTCTINNDDSVTWEWELTVGCGEDYHTMHSDLMTTSGLIEPQKELWVSPPVYQCPCVDLNRTSPFVENGLRTQISTDNVYVGVLNTSTSNRTYTSNVAMVGNFNTVASTGVVMIGDSNTSVVGGNSLLVGELNELNARQSLVVGDNNSVSGENSLSIGSNNIVNSPQSFVLGVGNEIDYLSPPSYTYSFPGITGSFGTYSPSSTQSLFMVGNNNKSFSDTGFVYGSDNYIGVSASNSVLFGSNNNLGWTAGPSGSSYGASNFNNLIIFGNDNTLIADGSQSFDNAFIIGSNITITQSGTSSLFYIGSDTIEINTQNIITNVVGTASFNKMSIQDLLIQDTIGSNPKFKFDQSPNLSPLGSNLEFLNDNPGLRLNYTDYDGGYLSLNYDNTTNYSSRIDLGTNGISLNNNNTTDGEGININISQDDGTIVYDYSPPNVFGVDTRNVLGSKPTALLGNQATQSFLFNTGSGLIEFKIKFDNITDNTFYYTKRIAAFEGNNLGPLNTIYDYNTMSLTPSISLGTHSPTDLKIDIYSPFTSSNIYAYFTYNLFQGLP